MFKKLFIILIILVSVVSIVSSGSIVPLHLDGSGVNGHLHADYEFLTPANKDLHPVNDSPEKMVAVFSALPILSPDYLFLNSFDETLNFPKRAPPA